MPAHVERWMIPYLTGKCFDYALALADEVADPVFVAVGPLERPDHVGLKVGDRYVDVRGVLSAEDFVNLSRDDRPRPCLTPEEIDGLITVVDRSVLELHAGLSGTDADGEPIPYEDSEDFCQAAEDVQDALSRGLLDVLERIEPTMP